jgi:hypothetical protein
LKLNHEANRSIQTLLSISPCGATTRMLTPHRHGLTLIHFSAQPEPFLSLNPSKVANKRCVRLAEKWTSVSPCTPAKCTSGGVAAVKEKKTIVGSVRIACPDPPRIQSLDQSGARYNDGLSIDQSGSIPGTRFTDEIGAKRANDPANHVAVTQSLDQSHEGLLPLVQTGCKHPPTHLPTIVS